MREQLQYAYNSLDYVDDLIKAGFNEKQSKAQAKALFRVIEQNAVTKQDLKELEGQIAYNIKELDVKLSTEIKELDVKLSSEIKELDVRIKELDVKLTYEIQAMQSHLTIKLSIIMAGMLTLAVTVMGFLINILH